MTTTKTAMLAHQFKKQRHRMQWPAYVQPKLDGIRCIAHIGVAGVEFYTRNGNALTTVGHLADPLRATFAPGTVVDGELYTDDLDLQQIASGAKRQSELSLRLQLWIYDLVTDEPFSERHRQLVEASSRAVGEGLVFLETTLCETVQCMRDLHASFVGRGFEGTIVRNANACYARGKRSADLQKVKDFMDDEFRIVGFREGTGKASGTVVWECETPAGNRFRAVPRGTQSQRSAWFREAADLVGEMLTVRFFRLTTDGIPFHPIGISIRNYD